MTWTFVGRAATEVNAFAAGSSLSLPAGTASGDLLVMILQMRGDITPVLPTGWSLAYAVNNANVVAGFQARASVAVGYIVRGAGAPSAVPSIGNGNPVRACVTAYRAASGSIEFVSQSTLNESAQGTAHPHPSIANLLANDLLVMAMANPSSYTSGGAAAVSDPAVASPAPTAGANGAVNTSAMPAQGAWFNRYAHQFSGGTTFGVHVADGLKSVDGATGVLTFATSNIGSAAGATMAFRINGAGGPGTVTVTSPTERIVFEGAAGTASVAMSGTHTGATSDIQVQIERASDSAVVVPWTTVATGVAAGAWAGNVTIPRGGWYAARVRKAADPAIQAATTTNFGVGVVLGALGQSHLVEFATEGTGTPGPLAVTWNGSAVVGIGSTGQGQAAMSAAIQAEFNCPVMWIQSSSGGTGPDFWFTTGGGATAQYTAWAARVAAVGGRLSAFLWWQGDFNTLTGDSQSSYTALMDAVVQKVKTDFVASRVIIGMLGRRGSSGSDTAYQAIRRAHVDYADNPGNFGFVTIDQPQDGDLQHFPPATHAVFGVRIAQCLAHAYGVETYSRGPTVAGATYTGAVVNVALQHEAGTDISPSTGITGFQVLSNGAPAVVTSAVRLSGSIVRLTMASALVAPVVVRAGFGAYPDVAGWVRDNTALALPLVTTLADVAATLVNDTTPPVLSGTITVSGVTTDGYTIECPAATDDIAVVGYQYRINGGAWVTISAGRAATITGRPPGSTDTVEMRAFDSAPNSSNALTTTVTVGASVSLTTEAFRTYAGVLLAGATIPNVMAIRISDRVVVLSLANQVTHPSTGVLSLTGAGLVSGVAYMVLAFGADGTVRGAQRVVAA